MVNTIESNMITSDNYRNELSKGILWIIRDSALSHGEKIFLLTLLSIEGNEYYDQQNNLFVVFRETNDSELASIINVDTRTIRLYVNKLTKEGYLLKLKRNSDRTKSIYVSIFRNDIYYMDTDSRLYLLQESKHITDIIKNHNPIGRKYGLESAHPGIFYILLDTKRKINLGRTLSKKYRSNNLEVFGPYSKMKLTNCLAYSKRKHDNVKRIKNTIDVFIVRGVPNEANAHRILLDCIYQRYQNNKCTLLINDEGKDFNEYMYFESSSKEEQEILNIIKKHMIPIKNP